MSANAGIAPGHAVTSAPNPPAPFVPGDPLFNVVNTAVPYQALVGDLVVTTSTSVTTPVGPSSGEYFAVKNVGSNTVSIVGTVDGSVAFQIPPATIPIFQESYWFVWNATLATWEVVSAYKSQYQWVWADAAARVAQTVSADQVGRIGYQLDLGVEFTLIASGTPGFWWGDYWKGSGQVRGSFGNLNNAAVQNMGHNTQTAEGALALVLGSATIHLERVGVSSSAVAGAATRFTSATGCAPRCSNVTYRFVWALDVISANWKWSVGLGAPTGNQDFSLLTNCVLFGRNGANANVNIFHNDAAGVSTPIDLGASFPASVAGTVYEGILKVPPAPAAGPFIYQLTNTVTLEAVSGIISTEIPAQGVQAQLHAYACNGGDASIVTIGMGNLLFAQAMRTTAG